MSASYQGLYINLDRCPDRRDEIESELARFGLSQQYKRINATNGNALQFPGPRLNNGEMGCFTSHYLALKENIGSDAHLHIVEDDALFCSSTAPIITRLIETGEIGKFDIIYTDVALPLANDSYKNFKALYDELVARNADGTLESVAFKILDLNPLMIATASSYLVNKDSIAKICALYHEELTAGAVLPIDSFLRKHAETGALKSGFVFPFVTSVRPERTQQSTVRKTPDSTFKFTAADIARMSFFIGCDFSECEKLMERLLPRPDGGDRHAQILADILAFSLIGDRDKPAPHEKLVKVSGL
jgi:hypothetical protein